MPVGLDKRFPLYSYTLLAGTPRVPWLDGRMLDRRGMKCDARGLVYAWIFGGTGRLASMYGQLARVPMFNIFAGLNVFDNS